MHKGSNNVIRLSQSCVGEEEKESVLNVLSKGYLGMGEETMLFEKELGEFFQNKVSVACVNTGTSALHLAIQACRIGAGDEVIVPSITYVASFQAVSATGAVPIACDIDQRTGWMDAIAVERKMTSRTKALMPVHYASGLGKRKAIFELAKKYNVRVIEDAAHSFGGFDKKTPIGVDGDITCFSFDGIKNITCGEGGAIVSWDRELMDKICDLRLLGVKKDTQNRYSGKRSWDFDVEDQGWRYHMSNINAAIGRAQLRKIHVFGAKRRHVAQLYFKHLQKMPLDFLDIDYTSSIIPHIFPILVHEKERDPLREFLLENNVETGVHYKPNHVLTKYKTEDCPQAEEFGRRVLSLPMHVNLEDEDVMRVIDLIAEKLPHP